MTKAQTRGIMVQGEDWGPRQPSKKREMIILIFCVVLGFALRFYTFDQKSLWMDEIYTFNDSRDDFKGQINFYRENPTYLHPPLFFLLTHTMYPFTRPERDLRILPMIAGIASIPMMYWVSRLFLPAIALPCTLALTFTAYHISLSQDARSYTLIMFFGMVVLYFFLKYRETLKKINLVGTALFASILFYTSYASIPFILLFQLLWLYQDDPYKRPRISSLVLLNALILSFCIPWLLFLVSNYKAQPLMTPASIEKPDAAWSILYGVVSDWAPSKPLAIVSIILLILLPLFSRKRRNGLILLLLLVLPIGGLSLFCGLFSVTHFISSRYFINFLPLFFICLFLSLHEIETRFARLRRFVRLKLVFAILLIGANLMILPLYYRSEKQDYRGLATYLKGQLRNGDKIVMGNPTYIGVLLHHLGVYPEGRHYVIPAWKVSEGEFEHRIDLVYQGITFTVLYSKSHWFRYIGKSSRLWIVADEKNATIVEERLPCVLKGVFDGRFFNLKRFPTDASMYLFLCDPSSPDEKGLDFPGKPSKG